MRGGYRIGSGRKKGSIHWNKGLTKEDYPQLSNSGIKKGQMIGEKHWEWKGDNVGYRALHQWIIRNLGKAIKCEFCNKQKTTPKSIQWANKSHKYKRNLADWISLCAKCHAKYDGNRGRRSTI